MTVLVLLIISTSLISTTTTHNSLRSIPHSVYGCHHGHDGTFFWSTSGAILALNISSHLTDEEYIAIGFSSDSKMGNDDAVALYMDKSSGKWIASSLYIPDGYGAPVLQSESDSSIVDATIRYQDGELSADIIKSIPLSRPLSTLDNTPVYLFFAKGRINPDTPAVTPLHKHYNTPLISRHRVALYVKKPTCISTRTNTFIKVHGLLMVGVWLNATLFAVYVARYAKFYFKLQSLWFTLHRAIGICSVLAVTVAVGCAYVGAGKTLEVGRHQVVGIIVLLTIVAHISLALFKPDKDTKYRRLWEYTHKTCGLLLQVLSIGNVVNGLYMLKVDAVCYWAISAQIVYYCMLFVTLENPQQFRNCINCVHRNTGVGTYLSLNARYKPSGILDEDEDEADSDFDDITMIQLNLDQPTARVDFTRYGLYGVVAVNTLSTIVLVVSLLNS